MLTHATIKVHLVAFYSEVLQLRSSIGNGGIPRYRGVEDSKKFLSSFNMRSSQYLTHPKHDREYILVRATRPPFLCAIVIIILLLLCCC